MQKKWLFVLIGLGALLLAACGQSGESKTMIGVTEIAKTYETMPHGEFKAQTGYEAELYHGERFISEIPNSVLSVIYRGKYDVGKAAAVLADDDEPIRLQGPLNALLDGLTEEMPLAEFIEGLSADGAAKPVYEILEGGGTAYYVGDTYWHISFDDDKDGQADRLILISVDESDEETIKPESLAWLERL